MSTRLAYSTTTGESRERQAKVNAGRLAFVAWASQRSRVTS